MAPNSDETPEGRQFQEGQVVYRNLQPGNIKSLLGTESPTNPVPADNTVVFDPPAASDPAPSVPTSDGGGGSGGSSGESGTDA